MFLDLLNPNLASVFRFEASAPKVDIFMVKLKHTKMPFSGKIFFRNFDQKIRLPIPFIIEPNCRIRRWSLIFREAIRPYISGFDRVWGSWPDLKKKAQKVVVIKSVGMRNNAILFTVLHNGSNTITAPVKMMPRESCQQPGVTGHSKATTSTSDNDNKLNILTNFPYLNVANNERGKSLAIPKHLTGGCIKISKIYFSISYLFINLFTEHYRQFKSSYYK